MLNQPGSGAINSNHIFKKSNLIFFSSKKTNFKRNMKINRGYERNFGKKMVHKNLSRLYRAR